jgi:hypothetical protein
MTLKRGIAALTIAAVHYIVFMATLTVTWMRAEKFSRAGKLPTTLDAILQNATEVLAFPLVSLCQLPMVVNSLLWGTVICFAVILFHAKKQSRHP